MLRVFVTGDNHIGRKYARHEQAALLAKSRIDAFEGMVDAANKEECDLFIITGDLFDNTYSISKNEISSLIGILSGFRGNVVVLPGNHDFYDVDVKVWQIFKNIMSEYDNIMLLTDYHPYRLSIGDEKVVLYPALCRSKHSARGENNLGWIKDECIQQNSEYHLGIAHGAVEGETIDKEGNYFLMTRSELDSIPVDAWFIGHTHVPFPRNVTEKYASVGKIFNAGTHVQEDVNCNTEGICFIVEIYDDKTIKAKKYVSGNLRFYRKDIHLTAGSMKETIERELSSCPDKSVVEIKVSGAVTDEEYNDRINIIDGILSRFIEGICYDDQELCCLISTEMIESKYAETSFSAVFLSALLQDTKEAQLAYELLESLKKEGK